MLRRIGLVLVCGLAAGWLAACATTKGAAVGAAVGGIAGDASKGARIGASAGFVVDVLD